MEAIVFIIFFVTRAIFKLREYSRMFHSFSWGIFGHVTRLEQSRASEKIWWIIIKIIQTYERYDGANKMQIEQHWAIPQTVPYSVQRNWKQQNLKKWQSDIWETKGNPWVDFLMVIMASGIARGRVRTTTTTESRNMAAILQITGWQRDMQP